MMMMMMVLISIATGFTDLNDLSLIEIFFFSKEKLNRNIETFLGGHRKVTVHSESSRH